VSEKSSDVERNLATLTLAAKRNLAWTKEHERKKNRENSSWWIYPLSLI
jgi:hypothetical protein